MNCLVGLSALIGTMLISHYGQAQCGSTGDPIVNITFGTSDNPDLGGGTTTYLLNEYGQLNDGEYRLASNVNQGRQDWQTFSDHTNIGQGMMLVANASYEPGEFYRIRVSGLCEATRFRFSAWIASANRVEECGGNPIPPNVRFAIEDLAGNIVAESSSGEIPPSAQNPWREHGFEFDTGDQTEFYLVLTNDNPGGCGNDLAIDDIQFRPCGPQITLEMDPTLKQADTLFFCEGATDPIHISSEISSDESYATTPAFQWQTRQNGQNAWVDLPGENEQEISIAPIHDQWYRLTAAANTDNLSNLLCRVSSDSVRIAQVIPQADIPGIERIGPICADGAITLDPPEYVGAGVGPLTYQWQLDEGNGPVDIPGATARAYEFQASAPGTIRLLRGAINVCGHGFITDTYEVEVMETLRTTFALPQNTRCADADPMLLTGGTIINGNGDLQGVYSGNGVSNGIFYPDIAGVGQHTITFSPPAGTLCAESSEAIITVYDTVYLEAMPALVMLPGQRVTLRPQTNAVQFRWSSDRSGLDDYHTQYPVASPVETTTYTLTASNAAGCEQTGDVTVIVLQNLIVPNSFSPNGDGINDTWEIGGLEDYPNVVVQVFNRWGTLVFSSQGYAVPWDGQFNGRQLPVGAYYYTISSDVLEKPVSGAISLLR
ncbi:gliding motility-associated C-terminal domain-containing protein [Parapedobacter sp. DT-150]|uniref:gliding motility-associated C-terminal domain-containing protein n=1 Tax=Parapedobacter sp. DT-150 TaxID=3396162 RepID=UPI003F1D788C